MAKEALVEIQEAQEAQKDQVVLVEIQEAQEAQKVQVVLEDIQEAQKDQVVLEEVQGVQGGIQMMAMAQNQVIQAVMLVQ